MNKTETITKEEVERIATLSRLNFDENEKEEMCKHLRNILKHFEMLDSVDVSEIEATAHILDTVNVLREDKAEPSADREKLLANAPEKDGGCYIVPKVIE